MLGTVHTMPLLTRDAILQTIGQHRDELLRLGARRLGLFGSFARNEAQPDSDVDLLVDLDRHTFDRYMDLKLYLEDLLGRRVDLVLSDLIKPALRIRILGSGIDAA
jgi:predicted nucleotidyltransferase